MDIQGPWDESDPRGFSIALPSRDFFLSSLYDEWTDGQIINTCTSLTSLESMNVPLRSWTLSCSNPEDTMSLVHTRDLSSVIRWQMSWHLLSSFSYYKVINHVDLMTPRFYADDLCTGDCPGQRHYISRLSMRLILVIAIYQEHVEGFSLHLTQMSTWTRGIDWIEKEQHKKNPSPRHAIDRPTLWCT